MPTFFYSSNKDMNEVVRNAVEAGWRYVAKGRSKHPRLLAPNGKDAVTVCLTPSDYRSVKNLAALIRRLSPRPTELSAA